MGANLGPVGALGLPEHPTDKQRWYAEGFNDANENDESEDLPVSETLIKLGVFATEPMKEWLKGVKGYYKAVIENNKKQAEIDLNEMGEKVKIFSRLLGEEKEAIQSIFEKEVYGEGFMAAYNNFNTKDLTISAPERRPYGDGSPRDDLWEAGWKNFCMLVMSVREYCRKHNGIEQLKDELKTKTVTAESLTDLLNRCRDLLMLACEDREKIIADLYNDFEQGRDYRLSQDLWGGGLQDPKQIRLLPQIACREGVGKHGVPPPPPKKT